MFPQHWRAPRLPADRPSLALPSLWVASLLRWLRTLCNLLPLGRPSLPSLVVEHLLRVLLQLLLLVGLLHCNLCTSYVDLLDQDWPQYKVWAQVGGCHLSWEAEFSVQVEHNMSLELVDSMSFYFKQCRNRLTTMDNHHNQPTKGRQSTGLLTLPYIWYYAEYQRRWEPHWFWISANGVSSVFCLIDPRLINTW